MILTVDFDATFGAGGTHFVGGFALIVTSGAARGAANNQSIKSVGIFSDLELRGLGDVIATFEPGHRGRRLAIDLTFEYDLKESKRVREVRVNPRFLISTHLFTLVGLLVFELFLKLGHHQSSE